MKRSISAAACTAGRRQFLQLCGGVGLWFTLPVLEGRCAFARGPERQKSLLTVWLGGGPSQLETWDPHAGTKIGGETKAIDTTISGAQIASLFPQVAQQIHHLNIVRSLVSKEGDHERGAYTLKTGYRPEPTIVHPSVGSILAYANPDSRVEVPQHVSLGDSEFAPRGGYLGAHFDAFRVFDPGRNLHNLDAGTDENRRVRRLEGLKSISKTFAGGRGKLVEESLHQQTMDAALRMMSSDQLKAFETKDEPEAVRTAYGDSAFGRGCLVARRLLEIGVRSIEVTMGGFDAHANNYGFHSLAAKSLDPALATLLKDLADRDLLQSTVVLVVGEFGRTPTINPLEGRDHWPSGFSCLVGGGGLVSGRVLGATDPIGEKTQPENPIEVHDLYATIFRTLGIDFSREIVTPIGRPIRFCEGQPVEALLA